MNFSGNVGDGVNVTFPRDESTRRTNASVDALEDKMYFDNVGRIAFPAAEMEKVSDTSTGSTARAIASFEATKGRGNGRFKLRAVTAPAQDESDTNTECPPPLDGSCCLNSALGPGGCEL